MTPRLGLPTVTPMVKRLLILNFGIYLATFLLELASTSAFRGVYDYLGLRPSMWGEWLPFFVPFWQLITHGFLHSPDPMHVIFNMLQLYFFGTILEGILDSRRFLVVYFGAMLGGALAHLVFQPLIGEANISAVGASGAVLGVVVGAAVMRPDAQILLLFIPVKLKWLAIGIVGIDLIRALQNIKAPVDNIAHWVHLGGAAFAFFAIRRRWIWSDPLGSWRARRAQKAADQRQEEDLKMDDLLAKIHKEGMGSLTKREREFLKKVSSRR